MPINFTHAGVILCLPLTLPLHFPLSTFYPVRRVGGKLHNKKLCLPFASTKKACHTPTPNVSECVCVSLKTYFASFIWQ